MTMGDAARPGSGPEWGGTLVRFRDRKDAGRQLAEKLLSWTERKDAIVLSLPRGGVPVGFELAQSLKLPLDIMLVRKLGVPGHEELAMGAIAMPDVVVYNHDIISSLGISPDVIERVVSSERAELLRRNQAYRQGAPPPDVEGKAIILVDDGMATGANMRAAFSALTQQKPLMTIVAIPVASREAYESLSHLVDAVICLYVPDPFWGVGQVYDNFDQTTDQEVMDLLAQARSGAHR